MTNKQPRIVSSGFSFRQLLMALLGGAAAGATAVYLTAPRAGTESRRRLRALADDTKEVVNQVPVALRRATGAACEAFNQALEEGTRTS